MNNELTHPGILGQRWGIRRYQNKDGSLTPEGKKHYRSGNLRFGFTTNEIGQYYTTNKKKRKMASTATKVLAKNKKIASRIADQAQIDAGRLEQKIKNVKKSEKIEKIS